jgi:hypothetical protein
MAMKRITLYRNKDCIKCARISRVHHFFDWFRRVDSSTKTPRIGPLRAGEIAVEDQKSGEITQGVDAVRVIARLIPAYWVLLPLLYVPFVARRVDREARGCYDGSCAVPEVARERSGNSIAK